MSTPKRSTRQTSNLPAQSLEFEKLITGLKKEIFSKFETEISSLKNCLNTLSSQFTRLEDKISSLQSKSEEHDQAIKKLSESIGTVKKELSSDILEEVVQRVQRQQNLIFTGIPESSFGTHEERNSHDQKAVEEVLDTIGMGQKGNSFRLSRIGKPRSDRPRLLKVDCQISSIKNEILRKAKVLRKSASLRKVFINEDRTPFQQLEWRLLRQKLKQRKDSGEDVVIYRNKVMLRSEVQGFHEEF